MHYHSRMNFLRFLMLLAIAIWLGALIFFPVVAQISFTALPSPHLAGLVVRNSLIALHWMGMGAESSSWLALSPKTALPTATSRVCVAAIHS